jgi:hypothetical protein
MYIGKVIGTVVLSVKISHLEGRMLLLVDQLDLGGKETGAAEPPLLEVDEVERRQGFEIVEQLRGAAPLMSLNVDSTRKRGVE